jgi:Protein of unknown function (DUF992)
MLVRTGIVPAAAIAGALILSGPAGAAGVKVGVLSCAVQSGWGIGVGSSRPVDCIYHRANGQREHYQGRLEDIGLDLGYVNGGEFVWGVVAPTSSVKAGALAGQYAGATAGATLGVGGDVHVLIGGLDKSIALQPISVQGNSGIDVTAGIGALQLHTIA